MRKIIAKERAVRRTRDQVRRLRVILSGASGRCASTPAAGDCLPVTPVGSILAAPQQGPCRFAHETGDSFFNKKPAEAGSCASVQTVNPD
jgi:hypothetical protein